MSARVAAFGMSWLLLPVTILAGSWLRLQGAVAGSGDSVRALRYRVIVYGSWLEWSHSFGRGVEELYFPQEGIVCNLSEESEVSVVGEPQGQFRMTVFRGKMRAALGEELQVPQDVAQQIFDLEELTRRQSKESARVAELALAAGICHGRWGHSVGGRWGKKIQR